MIETIYISTKKYVYFDNEGNIVSISNSINQEGNYVEVEYKDVENLISGKEFLHNYVVLFDSVEKNYVLKHKFIEVEVQYDVRNQIYQIPQKNSFRSDLVIYHDLKNKQWIFSLDNAIKDNVRNKILSFDQILYFSITRYNDPHQLEKFITLSFLTLVENDITIPFDDNFYVDPKELSIYTVKRLDTYHYEVLYGK